MGEMMATTLELVDFDTEEPEGSSATLDDNGRITYEGDGVRDILESPLRTLPKERVFRDYAGWSNGYVVLKERKA
jgi:hypothetical protein